MLALSEYTIVVVFPTVFELIRSQLLLPSRFQTPAGA
jgi:hypothetical protein